ncbi:GTPase IMAP family member 7-like [Crotalus adamanteus]|uniref:GTPase IMAP family member 7-like n=1 Tax=Crotalus adamanteus TaxID=8729 RepID=A0AAW1B2U2_CROAD
MMHEATGAERERLVSDLMETVPVAEGRFGEWRKRLQALPSNYVVPEVRKCVKFCSPGPHVILHVICIGRFTQEEEQVHQLITEIFGLKAKNYIILLFTHKEYLESESIENFISTQDKKLQQYAAECGNRFLAFNNKAEGAEREAQVAELMTMIDCLVETNRDAPYYTEEMMSFNKRRKF